MAITYELTRCVACGGRDCDTVAGASDLKAEREELWEFHGRRLREGTPTRYLADRVAFSQPDALQLVRCRQCGLVYRNPIERSRDVTDLYAAEELPVDVLATMQQTQLAMARGQAQRLTRTFGRAATVLEVGSFAGAFLTAARELRWTSEGVDVNTCANAWLRTQGHTVHDGTLHDAPPGEAVDVIAFWNCFDQLSDPAGALRDARERLRPGGMVVVRVPNGASYARLRGRRSAAARLVLATNNLLGFPYRYGFTPGSLSRLLGRTGFAVDRIVPDTLVPVADCWTRRWARVEERAAKLVVRQLARLGVLAPPWIEVYATITER